MQVVEKTNSPKEEEFNQPTRSIPDSSSSMQFVNTAAICEMFGVSRVLVDRWREREDDPLPAYRIGHWFKYDPVEAKAWFKRNFVYGQAV